MLVNFLFAIKLSSDIVNTVEISIKYTKSILMFFVLSLTFPWNRKRFVFRVYIKKRLKKTIIF
jgi:hypothetical protein